MRRHPHLGYRSAPRSTSYCRLQCRSDCRRSRRPAAVGLPAAQTATAVHKNQHDSKSIPGSHVAAPCGPREASVPSVHVETWARPRQSVRIEEGPQYTASHGGQATNLHAKANTALCAGLPTSHPSPTAGLPSPSPPAALLPAFFCHWPETNMDKRTQMRYYQHTGQAESE